MKEETKIQLRKFLQPIITLLLSLSISPNLLTILSLLFAGFGFFFFSRGNFLFGGFSLIMISLFDTLDGELARQKNATSRKGAFLDSVIDRLSEFLIFLGLFLHYQEDRMKTLIFLTLFSSFLVSYIRARAEGIGKSCRIGLFERPVRFLFLMIGSLFFPKYFPYFLLLIFIGCVITIFQRIIYIWKKTAD